MKRWIKLTVILLILAIAGLYLIIPAKIQIKRTFILPVNTSGAFRTMQQEEIWNKEWTNDSHAREFDRYHFSIQPYKAGPHALDVAISKDGEEVKTSFELLPLQLSATGIKWTCALNAGKNPITRFHNYFKSIALEQLMDQYLLNMSDYLSKVENVYQLRIRETTIKDTLLISSKETYNHYPSSKELYTVIDRLLNYISQNNAKPDGYPMMHIDSVSPIKYEAMLAVPINKQIPETSQFKLKRMVRGKLLTAVFKGGDYRTRNAMRQISDYVRDYKRASPAIPYFSLISNRMQVSDSSQWETTVNFPVF